MISIDNTPILTDVEPSSGCDISNIAQDIAGKPEALADVREVVMITTNEPLVECCNKMREIKQKTNTEIIHIALVCPCYKECDKDCDCDCDNDCKCGKDCKCDNDCKCEKNEKVQEINCCQKWFLPFLFRKS